MIQATYLGIGGLVVGSIKTDLTGFTHNAVLLPQFPKLPGAHLVQGQCGVLCFLGRSNQLIDFQMQNVVVPVLGVLDQEDHQERDDRRRCIDDQLPRIVEMKIRARHCPHNDEANSGEERLRTASPVGESLAEF